MSMREESLFSTSPQTTVAIFAKCYSRQGGTAGLVIKCAGCGAGVKKVAAAALVKKCVSRHKCKRRLASNKNIVEQVKHAEATQAKQAGVFCPVSVHDRTKPRDGGTDTVPSGVEGGTQRHENLVVLLCFPIEVGCHCLHCPNVVAECCKHRLVFAMELVLHLNVALFTGARVITGLQLVAVKRRTHCVLG